MRASTHIVFGSAIAVAAFTATGAGVGPLTIPAAVVGSLLPDIDLASSRAGRKIWPLAWIIRLAFGHRGMTHSLLALVAVTALLTQAFGAQPPVGAFAIGYLSHLFGDWITPRGIPVLWPIGRKYASPMPIRSAKGELAYMGTAVLAAALCLHHFGI